MSDELVERAASQAQFEIDDGAPPLSDLLVWLDLRDCRALLAERTREVEEARRAESIAIQWNNNVEGLLSKACGQDLQDIKCIDVLAGRAEAAETALAEARAGMSEVRETYREWMKLEDTPYDSRPDMMEARMSLCARYEEACKRADAVLTRGESKP